MTTEDDFQDHLDAHPFDHQTRLIFADWLQERDDPRAEGYRALGALRRYAYYLDCDGVSGRHTPTPSPRRVDPDDARCPFWVNGAYSDSVDRGYADALLPADWFELVAEPWRDKMFAPAWYRRRDLGRREVEDAAALAFARLPAARRAQLLGGTE